MPIIKMGYGYGLVGMGETSTPLPNSQPGQQAPVGAPGFTDGLKLWTTPSAIWPAVQALPAMFSAAPLTALGFLLPVLGVGFLLLGGGYAAGKRLARRAGAGSGGRAANPRRRRNVTRKRNQGREVVGQAKYVKVRVPFGKSRYQWQYDGPGGRIRVWSIGGPGAVGVSPGYMLDLQTGAVYRDSRAGHAGNPRRRRAANPRRSRARRRRMVRVVRSILGRTAPKRRARRAANPRRRNGRSYAAKE